MNELFVYCRQTGAEAMHCDCRDGYVGHNCETRLLDTSDTRNVLLFDYDSIRFVI